MQRLLSRVEEFIQVICSRLGIVMARGVQLGELVVVAKLASVV